MMNDSDFEQQLSRLPLRTPPPDWRAEILGAVPHRKPEPEWTWRDWLWPSPFAWGALAAVWLTVLTLGSIDSAAPIAEESVRPLPLRQPGETPCLYAFGFNRDFNDLASVIRP